MAKKGWRYPIVLILTLAAALSAAACAVGSWQSSFGRNHPVTGLIWEVSAAEFIEPQRLVERLARVDFVLLGERHDNPDHHRLQAEVLRGLIAAGRRPAVGFEMFELADAAAIAEHLRRSPRDAAGLGAAVDWNKRGWPDWAMYRPIAEAALEAGLPIVATNLPMAIVNKMRRDGLAALDPRARRDLGLDRPVADSSLARMAEDIRESHCGQAPEDSVKAMVGVQRARDAQMARSLITAGARGGAILVAGAGHVRNDYGIPFYLAEGAPGKRAISVAFLEVDRQKNDPGDYAFPYAGRLPFDYVWFTPRVDEEDPCEKFKAQFERLRKSQ